MGVVDGEHRVREWGDLGDQGERPPIEIGGYANEVRLRGLYPHLLVIVGLGIMRIDEVNIMCEEGERTADKSACNVSEARLRGLGMGGVIGVVLLVVLMLGGCDGPGAALSNVRASTDKIVPGSVGVGKPPGVVQVSYRLGREADVVATLDGPEKAAIFAGRQKAGDHVLRFNGTTASNDESGEYRVVRSVVPAGAYSISIAAGQISETVRFSVEAVAEEVPTLANVTLFPRTISPNQDALDDVAELTFRTDMTVTLSASLYDGRGKRTPVLAPTKEGPGEQSLVIDGKDTLGEPLPDGVYTATVRADDNLGNRVEARVPITIEAGGVPGITILSVEMTPRQIIAGGEISVTIRVKNTGNVPLRTQGPDPGFMYSTNDSYSSIEGGKWVDKAGLWRVGVDWDGNSGGGGAYRYPFRWGFGETLEPGEEAITGGKIRILKQERTMWFYTGVLQEGVRIVLDRLARTGIGVDF
ncbi:MAG: hypothetical protein WCD37_02090 [Chloroflexia bacterium]